MEPLYSVKARNTRKSSFKSSKSLWCIEALNEGFAHAFWNFNFISQLHKIKCPTLILAGEEDWICSPQQSKIMAKHIPHSQLKIFKKASHALSVDAHAPYISIIEKFLKKNSKDNLARKKLKT